MLAASSRLGPYEIIAPLGAGGMGEVYRARDTRLGREVAVKVLPEPFANNPDHLARFEREARAVAALSHPNILAIHDYGTHETVTYAVMELLEGETLRGRLSKGPLPWREAAEVGAAVAEGLAAAHAKGIVHRDLKPENLFLTADGQVKILDFGLARIMPVSNSQSETSPYVPGETNPGTVMGTVGYMSPEQVRGQPAEAPSDLFSFGCVLYEMVTGQRAFQRETAAETMTAILRDEPADPTDLGNQIPTDLGRLIRQCLAKNPHQRLQSARDLSLALRTTATEPRLHRPATRRPHFRLFVGVGMALLLIGVVATSAYLLTRAGKPADPGLSKEETKAFSALAILPFENKGDPGPEAQLSDPGETLAEHLSNSLSQVRRQDLKVRPFDSVARRYKQQRPDFLTIGRELNVQTVVLGTVRQQRDGLSVSVALVDTRDDNQFWGKRYDRKLSAILDLQDEIARDVAVNLRLRLTGEEEQRLTKRYTEDPEVYFLYREGIYHLNKLRPDEVQRGKEYFERALKKDPNYVPALMGAANSDLVMGLMLLGPRQTHPVAKKLLLRVLAIDDTLADAHAGLSDVYASHDWDWPAAEREAKRAFELGSHLPMYGFWLASHGRLPEALAALQRGKELDPLAAPRMNELAACYNWMRQPDQAIVWARKAIELDPNFPLPYGELGLALAQKGMHEEAIAELQNGVDVTKAQPHVPRVLGYAYAAAGRKVEARKVLEELKGCPKARFGDAFGIARIHAALGENDQAIESLQKACDERDPAVLAIKVDPTLDPLRPDPRFDAIVRRMGLAEKTDGRDQGTQSVAVLPFLNVGGDPKSEFLSDGVADQIINSLSQVHRRDLKVRPFTSVSRYKGKELNVPTFGRELNVQMIVTGRLQQQGDDLSISVAVVDVREHAQFWGKTYRGKRDAILDLQDQIARDVAVNLKLGLTGEEEQRLTRRQTDNSEAYLLYREGAHYLNQFTREEIDAGIRSCERAVAKDPKYALAHATWGRCYILLGALHRGPRETYPEARKHLTAALALDDSLPEARAGLGMVSLFLDWDWAAAERELKRAIAIDASGLVPCRSMYGFLLATRGQLPEALSNIQKGQELDPLAAPRRNEMAMCYNWMRQYDQAVVWANKALEMNPNFFLASSELGLAYSQLGKHAEAIAVLEKVYAGGNGHPRNVGLLGYAYAFAGQTEDARKVLAGLAARPERRFGEAFARTRIYAALGEKDLAFDWLQKALDERDSAVVWVKVDPTLDGLRSEPRFAQVLKDMGLPP